jgi:hypothetical protein
VGLSGIRDRLTTEAQNVRSSQAEQDFAFDRRAWQAISVDSIFPASVDYSESSRATAIRLGVERATCRGAFEGRLGQLLGRHGCGPVIRATYTDTGQTMTATVGVVLLDTTPAQQLELGKAELVPGADARPLPAALPGTAAASFGPRQQLVQSVVTPVDQPFVFFAVAGFADGRPVRRPGPPDPPGPAAVSSALVKQVASAMQTSVTSLRSRAAA